MKKNLVLTISMVIAAILCFCGIVCAQDTSVILKYGESELFTKEDMDAAFEAVMAEFAGWEGCVLHSVTYAGDEWNDPAAVKWLNQLKAEKQAEGPEYTECIMFLSSFHSPADGGGAWRPDDEYTVWQWWLGRPAGGDWQLMSWGY